MRKFVADSRTIPFEKPIKIELICTGWKRTPRKLKKEIKSMAKKVSTVEYLRYIVGNEND
jgi:hypothetical protein